MNRDVFRKAFYKKKCLSFKQWELTILASETSVGKRVRLLSEMWISVSILKQTIIPHSSFCLVMRTQISFERINNILAVDIKPGRYMVIY